MILPLLMLSLPITVFCANVLQITDFHFDSRYSKESGVRSEKCHAAVNKTADNLGECGDYICDSPECLVIHALQAAKIALPNPAVVLWTGDNIPHIEDYNETYVSDSVRTVTNHVLQQFPGIPVLPLFGNHDYAPANGFPDKNCPIYSAMFEMWEDWIGQEGNNVTFLKGGYYKYMLGEARLLALNTNLYYRFNGAKESFANPDDPADQFQFMEDNLEEAKMMNQSVHIIAHIAPGVFERTPNFTWMFPEYNQRFIDITIKYSSTIKSMIFGHHHTDTFHIVKDPSTKQPVQVYLMAPAVTPWFSTLDGAGANNPAFRILEYNEAAEDLLDVRTHYVNLDQLNKDVNMKWIEEYSMAQAYNIDKIDAVSMNTVLERMKNDDKLFSKYIEYNSVGWNISMPNGRYRLAQLCSIEFPDFEGYYACMKSPKDQTTTPAGSCLQSYSSFLLLLTAILIFIAFP